MVALRLTPLAWLNPTPEPVLSTDTNSSSHAPPTENCGISSPTGQYWSGTHSLHLWPSQTRWLPSNRAWSCWSAPATSVAAQPHIRLGSRQIKNKTNQNITKHYNNANLSEQALLSVLTFQDEARWTRKTSVYEASWNISTHMHDTIGDT